MLLRLQHRKMEILNEEEEIQLLITVENNQRLPLYHLAQQGMDIVTVG